MITRRVPFTLTGTEVAGSIAIAILTFILLNILRPYVTKRSEEEGKIDTLAANIEIVKENTAQLTAVAKKIEADISDRVWDRQARWNFRRDTYVRVLEILGEFINVKSAIAFLVKRDLPVTEQMRRDSQLFTDLWRAFSVCKVALSSDANAAIDEFCAAFIGAPPGAVEGSDAYAALMSTLRTKLVEIAKRDLSYEPFQGGS
jgi:membrane protein implicated in regulation of membrane protease activity